MVEKIKLESKFNFNWSLIVRYVYHLIFKIFVPSELLSVKIEKLKSN